MSNPLTHNNTRLPELALEANTPDLYAAAFPVAAGWEFNFTDSNDGVDFVVLPVSAEGALAIMAELRIECPEDARSARLLARKIGNRKGHQRAA